MRKNLLIIILLTIAVGFAAAQDADSVSQFRQYTSWSIAVGPNLSGYRYNLTTADNAPDRILPALGADAGVAISYHITPDWQLQLSALATLERAHLFDDDQTAVLATGGVELVLQARYEISIRGIRLQMLAGPYTHFTALSHCSNHIIANPYSRTNANNPRTENVLFALGDLCAGAALTLAVPTGKNWLTALDLKWGITDLLNADTHSLYIKPYKIAICVGRLF